MIGGFIMNFNQTYQTSSDSFSKFLSRAYTYMFLGLMITAVVALFGYNFFSHMLVSFTGMMLLAIVQLGITVFFTSSLLTMSSATAKLCFVAYSVITGVTLSYIPHVYGGATLAIAVLMTAIVFASMAIIGHTTHMDLSTFRPYLYSGLLAIIITTILNAFFFRSYGLDAILNYAGILIFLALIAYDMQKLRRLYSSSVGDFEMHEKLAVYGAFELYLDFINLFLRILQILSRNRRNN